MALQTGHQNNECAMMSVTRSARLPADMVHDAGEANYDAGSDQQTPQTRQ